ncbi:Voltage-gated potassium channel subunit beta-3 [Schistosoma japonicum]|nr:Voltage-gated potassium channel subunit beta-3 [Schistosoma japonicum]
MAEKIITMAYTSGINVFETGEAYSNGEAERTLGRILTAKNWRRSSYIVCCRLSKKRLQLEYVDIVIVTRQRDSPIPVEEVVRTCTHFIHLGWTFYWGTSEWLPCEIMQAQTVARQFNLIPPSVDQNELNLLNKNIGIMTGSPLSGGILTGKYIDCIPSFSRATLKNQQTWCLHFPLISSVVIGAATIDQLQENIRSVFIYPNLTASIISELDSLLTTTDSNDNFL